MAFKITGKDDATPPNEFEWVYPQDVTLFVEVPPVGRNVWREKLVSAIQAGERVCLYPGTSQPCHAREVISVEEF